MPLLPIIEATPEHVLLRLITTFNLVEPFHRYTLFSTDAKMTVDMALLFENESQNLLGIHKAGYDPRQILVIAAKSGFKIGDEYILDSQNPSSLTGIGIIDHHNVQMNRDNVI